MNNKRRVFVAMCLGIIGLIAQAQTDSILKLSVADAQTFAVEHNKTIENARKDLEISKKTVLETTSYGLPQVSASASFNNFLEIGTQLIPGEFFGMPPGQYAEVQFGTKYSTSFGATASQLVFSGPYIVGLQSAKIYKQLSQEGLQKTTQEVKSMVTNTYYTILATHISARILDSNIVNLSNTSNQSQLMAQQGMIESVDADQIKSTLTTLQNSKRALDRQLELSYNMLKYQLGVTADIQLELTDSLQTLINDANYNNLMLQTFDINENIDYKLATTNERLMKMAWKREKTEYLPSISAFYSYEKNAMSNELKFDKWYNTQLVGLSVNMPIFNSGTKYAKTSKARINYEKAKNEKYLREQELNMKIKQARYDLKSAMETFNNQKENIEIAKRILANYQVKYNSGIVSSLDYTQANNNYLSTESSYISAIISVLNAKINLDKILNNL